MSSSAKAIKHKLVMGEQWQHDITRDSVEILLTYDVPYLYDDNFIVVYFNYSKSLRESMPSYEFLWDFTHVPKMKGAYK